MITTQPMTQAQGKSPLPIRAYGPLIGDGELQAISTALRDEHLVGAGPIGRRVENRLQELFGAKHALLTASCTAALELAMLALDIGPGDEVIMPSFTFVSTANCVVLRGARPAFAEICEETLNLDPRDVERRVTGRTRAIIPIHYAGVACDMIALQRIADKHGLMIVEDAAHAIDAMYHERYLGTLGAVGCFSFHATKNITCGEGGALLTNDPALAHRAEIIREKGTNRAAYLRGEVDKYTWVAAGSSYILSDLLAALLEAQLERREEIKARRQAVWQRYQEALAPLAAREWLSLPAIPEGVQPNYHIFFLLTRSVEEQEALLAHLKAAGVPATFHYVPLHSSPFGRSLLAQPVALPVTERVASTLVRLPVGAHLRDDQADYVADQVLAFYKGR